MAPVNKVVLRADGKGQTKMSTPPKHLCPPPAVNSAALSHLCSKQGGILYRVGTEWGEGALPDPGGHRLKTRNKVNTFLGRTIKIMTSGPTEAQGNW